MMKTYLYYRGGLNDSGQYIHERSEDGIQWEVDDPEQVINFIEYGFDPAITDSSQRVTHHCPGCEAAARELAGARGNVDHLQRSLYDLEDRFLKLQIERDEWESKYIASREHNEKLTTDNYRLAMVEQELADLKSDKAWDDKLSAENADELSNLRREHDALRAGILRVIEDYPRAIKQDAEEALRALVAGTVAPVSGDSDLRARLAALLSARTPPYISEIECNAYARGRADVLEEIRALLAETEQSEKERHGLRSD